MFDGSMEYTTIKFKIFTKGFGGDLTVNAQTGSGDEISWTPSTGEIPTGGVRTVNIHNGV